MSNLFNFLKNKFHLFLFVLLLVVSIVMINRNMSYPHYIIATTGQQVAGPVYDFWNGLMSHFDLERENQDLTEQNRKLMQLLNANYLIQDDSTYIYTIETGDSLKRQKQQLFAYLNATVIFNTIHKTNNYMIIDKGAEDGITPDMAVIAPQGVVGIVDNVSAHFASVVSLLHPNSRLSAKIMPINQLGTILWDTENSEEVTLHDIPQHLNIEVGDKVITSGYSTVFPADIPIGEVSSKKSNTNNSFLNITVKLSTPFDKLNHVFVVKNLYRSELDTLKNKFKYE
jgi:rod shape-determining protein MreC